MQEPDDERKYITPERSERQSTALAISGIVISLIGVVATGVFLLQTLQVVSDDGVTTALHFVFRNTWWVLLPVPVTLLIQQKVFGTRPPWALMVSTAAIAASAMFALI